MNYDVLEAFQPLIINIAERTEAFWPKYNYDSLREDTEVHSLALIYSGQGSLEVNGSVYALKKGNLMYIPTRCRMRLTTEPANPLMYYSVLFHYGELRWEGTGGYWKETSNVPLPLKNVFVVEEYLTILEYYQRLTGVWNDKKPGYVWQCKMEFIQLLHRVMRWMLEDSQEARHSAALIESVTAYLKDRLNEPFDRTALAAKLALSPGYFSVLFKQYTGCTPVEYVTRLRIDRAKQLLMHSEMPVRRIAAEVGYDDPLYFTRLFSRETGISPREFRKL